ncbi:hypothetical protein ABV409_15000 [Flagellimonas sp. DF-77]|uniref:hypothetical protein n=1 Tax=Flagellimonas algarum TaxID=3230298 RepID=UPI003393C0BA
MGIRKVKAGSLQLVLFVGAVIAVLLFAFLLIAHAHRIFNTQTDITVSMIQSCDRNMQQSLSKPFVPGRQTHTLGPEEGGMEISQETSYWGLLPLIKVSARKGKMDFVKVAFAGRKDKARPALYLQERQRPLVVVGDAQIVGNALLPQRGVKPGNIAGKGYRGRQLVYGTISPSATRLPKTERLDQVWGDLASLPFEKGTLKLRQGLQVIRSFSAPPQLIEGGSLVLDDVQLSGHIVIKADREIRVRASAKLNDLILIAPKIVIDPGTVGNFQAFASRSIVVGEKVRLQYPTVLQVTHRNKGPENTMAPDIELKTGADVRGMVLFEGFGDTPSYKANIKIHENTLVQGEIYCTHRLELKGTVWGSVTTSGFIAMENGNSYQNHLFNGIIDSSRLPEAYGGLDVGAPQPNTVVKWLY